MTLALGPDEFVDAESLTLSTYVLDFAGGTVTRVANDQRSLVLDVGTDRTVTEIADGTPSAPQIVREVDLDGVERREFGALSLSILPFVRAGGDGSLFVVGTIPGGPPDERRTVARIGGEGITAVATGSSPLIFGASASGRWALFADRGRLSRLEPAPLSIVDPVAGSVVDLPLPTTESIGFSSGWFADADRLVVGWWSELPSGRSAIGALEVDADGRPVGEWRELAAWSPAERDPRSDACSPPAGAGFVGASADTAVMELVGSRKSPPEVTLCRVRLQR